MQPLHSAQLLAERRGTANPGHSSSVSDTSCQRDEPPGTSNVPDESDITDESVEPLRYVGLIDVILKNRTLLHRLIRNPALKPTLIPRFLAISLGGFVLFGVAMTLVLNAAGVWPKLAPIAVRLDDPKTTLVAFTALSDGGGTAWGAWFDGSAAKLILAYSLGLIAASGICLPSLYFYGLLAGVKMSMLDVTIHSLKAKATAALALVGILPIYAAVGLGMVIFAAPAAIQNGSLILGLILPFIAGLWGTNSLYVGFATLCDTMPLDRRTRRECFLRRLVFSWSVCYTAVSPVMVYTLWQWMGT